MKIKLLGTSDGYPTKERKCSCSVITINGKHYIIDAGLSLYTELIQNDYMPEDVKGIFITHMHGDHASGLVEYVDFMVWGRRKTNPAIFVPTIQGKLAIETLAYAMDGGREVNLNTYKEGVVFEDENIKVTAFRTTHGPATFGFFVEGDGKKVYFTGDLAGDLHDLPELVFSENLDLVICESAHNCLPKVADKFNAMTTKQVVINHLAAGHSFGEFEECKPMINKTFTMAFDGMEINL